MLPSVVAREIQDSLVDYLRTTFRLQNAELEKALFSFLESREDGLFRGPYLDLRLPFRQGAVEDRSHGLRITPPYSPHAHQQRAWSRLSTAGGRTPQSTLVTTGTGSGKTECFLYPLLDHCLRARQVGEEGVKAIILYPMNALATDQAGRFAQEIYNHPELRGVVSAGLYVGGAGSHGASGPDALIDQRSVLRQSPPDILLTNYRMLDFLLMRPEDRPLWRFNRPGSLRYIVLDELHTYDGAQGADVACLLRRLKSRLHVPKGALCAVGTSATIGGPEAGDALRRFAGAVFEEEFAGDALIGEDRYTLVEAFEPPDEKVAGVRCPWDQLRGAELDEALRAGAHESATAYVTAQSLLWLGTATCEPVALGELLMRHAFLRRLIEAVSQRGLSRGPRDQAEVLRQLAAEDADFAGLPTNLQALALASFLALVSTARKLDDKGRARPLMDVQVQLWVKELRGLVMRVQASTVDPSERYKFAWRDELVTDRDEQWAPIVYCRECGESGIGAVVRDGHEQLRAESRVVGDAYFQRKRQARFVRLSPKKSTRELESERPYEMCPACLHLSKDAAPCAQHAEKVPRISVRVMHREHPETKRFLPHCPVCEAEYGLMMLGGRITSLSSVVVGRLFQSRHQDVLPKLLAFTDSVQDASHRAGFFGGRTYRFNLRSAMARTLDAHGGEAPLEGFEAAMLAHHASELGEARALAAFLPADLREHPAAEAFHRAGEGGVGDISASELSAMRALVLQRLSWEVTRELGLGVHVGHSLEVSGVATLELPRDALADATEFIRSVVREELPMGLLDEEVPLENVRHFIEGLCTRIRQRGGICHPLLDTYMKTGSRFMLSRRKNAVISPFARDAVLPRFLLQGHTHDTFDALFSRPSARGYIRDWVERSLAVPIKDAGIDHFLRRVVDKLVDTGILRRIEAQGDIVCGLEPRSLRLTTRVKRVRCDTCTRTVLLPEATAVAWDNQRCDRYRCRGWFRLADKQPQADYYERLFRSGRMQRVFAHEHTGLLSREAREPLERAFKEEAPDKRPPDAPNLLTCTPTLEMGIDIGALSSVMLCSVPPRPANYIQRVGRAGRKHGSALVATMVRQHPHDLSFFARPEPMLRGEVQPPGVFLDAPEMLLRQMTAHALDHWAQNDESLVELPKKMTTLLSAKGDQEFPLGFFAYYTDHRGAIAADFFSLFPALAEATRTELAGHVAQDVVVERIKRAFKSVADEIARLSREIKALERREEALTADAQRQQVPLEEGESFDDAVQKELEAVEDAQRALRRVRTTLRIKNPLNVLTDAGVLPNYAFPEPGVTLQAVLRGERGKDGEKAPKTKHEYMRPASAAIREFAPFNTFYAEGHQVKVAQIPLGTKTHSEVEVWRLCPACHHVDDSPGAASAGSCPRCAEARFADQGSLRNVVRFKQAWSNMDRADAVVVDDTEDREERHYSLLDLVDVGSGAEGALYVQTDEVTFGYELIRHATFRQLNFGEQTDTGPTLEVAGEKLAQHGFEVCVHCGRVQDPREKARRAKRGAEHVPYCPTRAGKVPEETTRVLLSRSMSSEALRILLPTAGHDPSVVPTLRAALQLGFRKHFGGSADHLDTTWMSETTDEGKRSFLVFYDKVPGGTGYLADLWKDRARFFGMLRAAHDHLLKCFCEDGCYRCLHSYRDSASRQHISRLSALRWLGLIIANEGNLQEAKTLGHLRVELALESELEVRFVQLLERFFQEPNRSITKTSLHGVLEYVAAFGTQGEAKEQKRWRIVPQVSLGPLDGVAAPCKPDFVAYPLHGQGQKVAIFCDGHRYHVLYDEKKSRLGDDVLKRRAILESGHYWVWSLTWKDIDLYEAKDSPEQAPSLLTLGHAPLQAPLKLLPDDAGAGRRDNVRLLLEYLEDPNAARWRTRALYAALSIQQCGEQVADPAAYAKQLMYEVGPSKPAAPTQGAPSGGRQPWGEWAEVLVYRKGKSVADVSVVARLHDTIEQCASEELHPAWRAWLHAKNLLQHLGSGFELVDTQYILDTEGPEPMARSVRPPPAPAVLGILADDPEARPLYEALVAGALPLPVEFPDVQDAKGEVILQAEYHFPVARVAVVNGPSEAELADWALRGYRTVESAVARANPSAVIELLRA
jgi:DEAD/DEAH box helicase domain-containing protein